MIAHAAQMCLKHRAALAMPSLNLYPQPLRPLQPFLPPLRSPSLPLAHFAPTIVRLVIRANLIARRHRWPLTGIELSAVSLPVQEPPAAVRTPCGRGNDDIMEF